MPIGAPSLGGYKGTSTGWEYHDVVVKDGRVFDAFGPSEGITISKNNLNIRTGLSLGFER